MNNKILKLTEELFYGKGTHKKCYRHPDDSKKCIKMAYSAYGQKDLDRELAYLKVLNSRWGGKSILPEYYGTVETTLGIGHVYEFIINHDGSSCKTLEDFLNDEEVLKENYNMLHQALLNLKAYLLENGIITMGLFPENILFQKNDKGIYVIRLVNDMGSAALIPLEYYIGFIARIRINKRWNRFIQYLKSAYSDKKIVLKLADEIE